MEPDGTAFIVTLEVDATLRTAPGSSRAAETAQSGSGVDLELLLGGAPHRVIGSN
jgi:hypothetical protein